MIARALVLVVLALAVGAPPAGAQQQVQPPAPAPGTRPWVQPPAQMPRPQAQNRPQQLEQLFAALKASPDARVAKLVEGRIWALMFASGSDAADLLMQRARVAIQAREHELALELLDVVVALAPDHAEGWYQRGSVLYVLGDPVRALADLRRTLALEPRHFGALAGTGVILTEYGDERRALDAFRRALDIHPFLEDVPEQIRKLEPKVQGRDI